MIRIEKITNQDPDFYVLMGPFLSRRYIVDELGCPVWDDPGKRWYLAWNEKDELIGFAAAREYRNRIQFCSAWIKPPMRCHGAYTALLESRLSDWGSQHLIATATVLSMPVLDRHGFTVIKQRGKYFDMQRTPR